jgi:AcrR family transcriptional regulator
VNSTTDASTRPGRPSSGRREQAADAALAVLAERGSRGLTHRAVDEIAGLPPGTASNHFRTRSALLEAALRRHVELDLPPGGDPEVLRGARLTRADAAELFLASAERILEPGARALLVARYELLLESTRRDELHRRFREARERFVELGEAVLAATGCESPRRHAVQVIALLDGILLDQLIHADSALDRAGISDAIERQLATC